MLEAPARSGSKTRTKKRPPRLMVFDLSRHQHLPGYLRFLITYWCTQHMQGMLHIVVWPTFISVHRDVVDLAADAPEKNVQFHTLTQKEQETKLTMERRVLESAQGANVITFSEFLRRPAGPPHESFSLNWELFRHYAEGLGATHAFIIHLDSYLPLLACGFEPPCPLSGIYFAPTFHYGQFSTEPLPDREKARHLREKFIMARALKNPSLKNLFLLDPLVVKEAIKFPGKGKVFGVTDPVHIDSTSDSRMKALHSQLDIDPERAVFLVFGHLTKRKGCEQLLNATRFLTPDVCGKICFLFVGTIDPGYRAELESRIGEVSESTPVQVVQHYAFVPQGEVPTYFGLSSAVVTLYQQHAGMSGVMLLAAAAQKPVLSSDHGLMGEIVRQYELGTVVDATQPREIARGLSQLLDQDAEKLYNRGQMKLLADRHRPEKFAAEIFGRMGFFSFSEREKARN